MFGRKTIRRVEKDRWQRARQRLRVWVDRDGRVGETGWEGGEIEQLQDIKHTFILERHSF